MAGKVSSNTNDLKDYELDGYHKQGSIEDENFLNLADKLTSVSSQMGDINDILKEFSKYLFNLSIISSDIAAVQESIYRFNENMYDYMSGQNGILKEIFNNRLDTLNSNIENGFSSLNSLLKELFSNN